MNQMRKPTIILGEGLAIEAEAVIGMTKGDIALETESYRMSEALQARILRFELETGNSISWVAPSETEVDRVMREIVAVKRGELTVVNWRVTYAREEVDPEDGQSSRVTRYAYYQAESAERAKEMFEEEFTKHATLSRRFFYTQIDRVVEPEEG